MLRSGAIIPVAGDVPVQKRLIGSVTVCSMSEAEADAFVSQAVRIRQHLKLAFANSHLVNLAATDERLRLALARFTVVPDGIGVDLGSRILYGAPFSANLNGTDFVPRFLGATGQPLTVALLGARPGVANKAAEALRRLAPHHRYVVSGDGFFAAQAEPALLAKLAVDRPDILLVAFGNPRQELWIADKLGQEHCSAALGVGALFDFLAGEVVRAPRWVRIVRLEWLFRLAQEPARLWRRYVLGNPAFLMRMLVQKWRGLR